jgi:hypothetical protein
VQFLIESGGWFSGQELKEREIAGFYDQVIAQEHGGKTRSFLVETVEIDIGSPELEALIFQEAGGGAWITKDGKRIFIGGSSTQKPSFVNRPSVDSGQRAGTEEILQNNGFQRAVHASEHPQNPSFEAQGHNWTHPNLPRDKVFVNNNEWHWTKGAVHQSGTHRNNADLEEILKERQRFTLKRPASHTHLDVTDVGNAFSPSSFPSQARGVDFIPTSGD